MKSKFFILMALLAVACWAPGASAVTYGFNAITANEFVDVLIGEAQLYMDVTDPGGAGVLFTFRNIGPNDSSICDIYFYDGALLGATMSIINSSGVSFSENANPAALPGGNPYGLPPASVVFSADSDSAVAPNGVNPGESLGIQFALASGKSFGDVIAALNAAIANPPFPAGSTVVGIRVQGFEDGGSEGFVHTPLPPSVLLLGSGLLGLGLLGVRRKRL